MKEENKQEFITLMNEMVVGIGVKPDIERVKIYWKYLKKYKMEHVRCGVEKTINLATYRIFPLIGEIIKNMD